MGAGAAGLGRGERLRVHGEIQRLFRLGTRLERAGFVLLWRAVPSQPRSAAVIAGRRLGPSVLRNRARRRLREAYRLEKGALPSHGIYICIVARRESLTVPLTALRRSLAQAMSHVAEAVT